MGQHAVSVHNNAFRAEHCILCIYQNHETPGCNLPWLGHTANRIPRRHVNYSPRPPNHNPTYATGNQNALTTGLHNQTNSKASDRVPMLYGRYNQHDVPTATVNNNNYQNEMQSSYTQSYMHGSPISSPTRFDDFLENSHQSSTDILPITSIRTHTSPPYLQEQLQSGDRAWNKGPVGPEMVDIQFHNLQYVSYPETKYRSYNSNRRIPHRVGSRIQRAESVRPVVTAGEATPHKRPRAASNNVWDHSILQTQHSRSNSIRQSCCNLLHQQAGGYSLSRPLQSLPQNQQACDFQQYHFNCRIPTGDRKHRSRQTIPPTKPDWSDWRLLPSIFTWILQQTKLEPEIDLFASRLNTQLPMFMSWRPEPGSAAINAFVHNWTNLTCPYQFPPMILMAKL